MSIALVLLFQVSALFLRSVSELWLSRHGTDPVAAKYFGALLGIVALGIFLTPVICSIWPAFSQQFRHSGSRLRLIAASMTLGVALWVANAQLLLLLSALDWLTVVEHSHSARLIYQFECSRDVMLLLAIPVMAMATPAIEEICNRGLILQALLPKGRFCAILISSAMFALLHKPGTYATAFVFGLFVSVLALNWRSLWGPIIAHGTFNLLVELDRTCLSAYWLPGRLQWQAGNALVHSISLLIVCLCTACLLVSIRRPGATCKSIAPTAWTDFSKKK